MSKKRIRIGSSIELLEERNLLSMPGAYVAPPPVPIQPPPVYVYPYPTPPPVNLTPPSNPVWPTAPAQTPVYGPYDPNDPLQKGVTIPPATPYYGPNLPTPTDPYGPSIQPMPPVPSLIPTTLP